jgi:hypothetical protein
MKKFLLTGFALVSIATQAQTWVAQATTLPTSFAPREISIVDANTVWASVSDGSGAGTYPKTWLRTINGGTNWTKGTIAGPPTAALVGDIAGFSDQIAWVVTAPSTGTAGNGVYKTINGGTSWTKQSTAYSTVSFANLIYFWDANIGVTAGDPKTSDTSKFEIYTTTNGGTNWTLNANAPSAVGGGYGLTGVKYVNGNNFWFGTTTGKIARSTDRGLTWNIYFSPALDFGGGAAGGGVDGSSAQMAYKDGSNGLLITADDAGGTTVSALYSTTDGGATWSPVTPTGPWYYGGITHVPGTANTYVSTGITNTDATATGSSYTTDGGVTWIGIDNGQQRGTVSFLNPTTGWCGYFSDGPTGVAGIFKFSGNLALATNENAVKSALKVYPNPAVDVINVSANKEIKALSVIDLSGKRVKTSQTKGELNVSSFAKGPYILQVYYANGAVENTKLIKK